MQHLRNPLIEAPRGANAVKEIERHQENTNRSRGSLNKQLGASNISARNHASRAPEFAASFKLRNPDNVDNESHLSHAQTDSFARLPQMRATQDVNANRPSPVMLESIPIRERNNSIETPTDYQFRALASLMQSERDMPKLEVLKFDGDPSKYTKFIRTFEETVGAANLTFRKKLLYLVQHCEDDAKR